MLPLNFKVVTLNIWGITYISKDLNVRLKHFIDALKNSDYDVIALQEVWNLNDYRKIKKEIFDLYPYSHYFHSGVVGSGCCVFTKHPIVDSFKHKFSLNGYPHKIQHCDWFAGKLVGLVVLKYQNLRVHVYVTHLHANYSSKFKVNEHADEYLAHRTVQLFELGQFVRKTSELADFSLLLGDLNTREYEKGYKLLRSHTGLLDAFKERLNHDGSSGETCNVKNNFYKPSVDVLTAFPDGCRIDYILYKHNESIRVDCVECKTCFSKIPEHSYLSYSDHEGVYGQFKISKANEEKKEIKDNINAEIEHYLHAQEIIQINMHKLSRQQQIFIYLGLGCFLILSLLHFYLEPFDMVQNTILFFVAVVLFLYAVLSTRIEQRLLKSALESIRHTANAFHKNK